MTTIDFIGVGAERSGTSWIYACLYEHPEICAPIKELHFFSRPRYEEGIVWYLKHFNRCSVDKKKGEFSTSYLYSSVAAERIHIHFPNIKIIMSLRNPVDRAYSQYRNEMKAGHIAKTMSFEVFIKEDVRALEQGYYFEQVERYLNYFGKEQVCILVYEDSLQDPHGFVKKIYEHIGVTPSFVPSMLRRVVNRSRTPLFVSIDRVLIHVAEYLRRVGLDRLVWYVKKSGLPQRIRKVNTTDDERTMDIEVKKRLQGLFREDAAKLSQRVGRDLVAFWGLGEV